MALMRDIYEGYDGGYGVVFECGVMKGGLGSDLSLGEVKVINDRVV